MTSFKKIISVLLISVILLSGTALNSSAIEAYDNPDGFLTEDNIVSASKIINFLEPALKIYEIVFGNKFIDIDINDTRTLELCGYISENSDLDIVNVLQKIPVKASGLEAFYKLTNTDTTEIRNSIYDLRDKAYAEKNDALGLALFIFGAYISVIESAEVYTVPFENDGSTRVVLKAYFMDGTSEVVYTDIYFSKDGYVYGPNGSGLQLLGFECSVYDLMIYASVNCWMRDFGFCFLYDLFCYTTPFFNYETRRFKFDYADKEWMIQVWKGNYIITNGAEVGIYNREPGSIGTFYNCYDDEMNMTLKLSCDDDVIYDIKKEHWWINGFKLTEGLYDPEKMIVEFSIEFPEEAMAQAFADSVENHYKKDASCVLNQNIVAVIW